MKNKELFLEDNGHYWIQQPHSEPEIGKYQSVLSGFLCIAEHDIAYLENCKVLSRIILRPTE